MSIKLNKDQKEYLQETLSSEILYLANTLIIVNGTIRQVNYEDIYLNLEQIEFLKTFLGGKLNSTMTSDEGNLINSILEQLKENNK